MGLSEGTRMSHNKSAFQRGWRGQRCVWAALAAAAGAVPGLGVGVSLGQTITFAHSTDTVAFSTACLPNANAATLEVRFKVSGTAFGGQFYGEHEALRFDRQLGL